jgi:hypothetical protein
MTRWCGVERVGMITVDLQVLFSAPPNLFAKIDQWPSMGLDVSMDTASGDRVIF